MFERIKSYFRDIRINLDYPEFERRLRNEHEQHAQRRFSTKELSDEKETLVANIESQASATYDAALLEKKVERNRYKEDADDTESLLWFFLRDYKQELDAFYAEKDVLLSTKDELFEKKSEIGKSLSEAFEEKNKAFRELNYYKDRIDSWYAKSDRTPWLFGNAGTKLPKHSLFGQSFGDLDSYKYHRDSAYNDVREAKRRIGNLKQDQQKLHSAIEEIKKSIGDLFGRMNEVKDARSKMYELKKAGYKRGDLQSKLDGLRLKVKGLSAEIDELCERKKGYVIQEKHRCGVVALEAKMREIAQKKKRFADSFDLEENERERKRLHRELWLRQRGVA